MKNQIAEMRKNNTPMSVLVITIMIMITIMIASVALIITTAAFMGCASRQATIRASYDSIPTPDNRAKAEAEYSIAYEYLKNSKYDEAIPHFQEAIKIWPKYYGAYIALAQAYRATRNIILAESTYILAKTINTKDTRAYEGLGLLFFMELKDYDRAVNEYKNALALDSLNVNILNSIAAVYSKIKEYDKALEYYSKSLACEPENLSTNFAIAKVYIDKNEPEKALNFLETLKARRPEIADIRKELGDVYLQMKKYDEAAEEFSWLVSRYPDNINYRLQLGLIYQRQKKYQAAQEEYEEAKRLAPTNATTLLYLSELYITMGKLGSAETAIKEAFSLLPDSNSNAYGNILLGDIYEQRGLKARQIWEKKKDKANKDSGITAVNHFAAAVRHYCTGKSDDLFASYATNEIERCNNWIKQLKEELWYIGVKT